MKLPLYLIAASVLAWAAPAHADEVFWQAEAPCTDALTTPLTIPGATLAEDGLRAAAYDVGGEALVVVHPDVRTHPIPGQTFAQAWRYMLDRRPLQDRIARATEPGSTLASVRNLVAMQYLTRGEDTEASIRPGSVTVRITPRMRLADWTGRSTASDADAALWDRLQCEHIHHELGHVAVAAQTLAESLPQLADIRGSEAEVEAGVQDFMDRLDAQTDARQDRYHDWIAAWGRTVAHARPYAELGFPWLNDVAGWDELPPPPVELPAKQDDDLATEEDILQMMRDAGLDL